MSHQQKIGKNSKGHEFAAGQLILSFKNGTSDQQAKDFLAEKGFTVLNYHAGIGMYLLAVPEGQEEALVNQLKANPLVELNGISHIC